MYRQSILSVILCLAYSPAFAGAAVPTKTGKLPSPTNVNVCEALSVPTRKKTIDLETPCWYYQDCWERNIDRAREALQRPENRNNVALHVLYMQDLMLLRSLERSADMIEAYKKRSETEQDALSYFLYAHSAFSRSGGLISVADIVRALLESLKADPDFAPAHWDMALILAYFSDQAADVLKEFNHFHDARYHLDEVARLCPQHWTAASLDYHRSVSQSMDDPRSFWTKKRLRAYRRRVEHMSRAEIYFLLPSLWALEKSHLKVNRVPADLKSLRESDDAYTRNDPEWWSILGQGYAALGNTAEQRRVEREAFAILPCHDGTFADYYSGWKDENFVTTSAFELPPDKRRAVLEKLREIRAKRDAENCELNPTLARLYFEAAAALGDELPREDLEAAAELLLRTLEKKPARDYSWRTYDWPYFKLADQAMRRGLHISKTVEQLLSRHIEYVEDMIDVRRRVRPDKVYSFWLEMYARGLLLQARHELQQGRTVDFGRIEALIDEIKRTEEAGSMRLHVQSALAALQAEAGGDASAFVHALISVGLNDYDFLAFNPVQPNPARERAWELWRDLFQGDRESMDLLLRFNAAKAQATWKEAEATGTLELRQRFVLGYLGVLNAKKEEQPLAPEGIEQVRADWLALGGDAISWELLGEVSPQHIPVWEDYPAAPERFTFPLPPREGWSFPPSWPPQGYRGALISFYAKWCAACKDDVPYIKALQKRLIGRGLSSQFPIIIINADEDQDLGRESMTGAGLFENGMEGLHVLFGGPAAARQFMPSDNRIRGGMPYNVLINADSSITHFLYNFSHQGRAWVDDTLGIWGLN